MKKKFKDTKVGQFLLNNGSGIVNTIGDVLPNNGVLGLVKGLIDKDESLPPEDKEKALKLLEMDMVEMQKISKRWNSDMTSDSWLSKNTRPMTLIFLTVSMVCLILLDSFNITFEVDRNNIINWVSNSFFNYSFFSSHSFNFITSNNIFNVFSSSIKHIYLSI